MSGKTEELLQAETKFRQSEESERETRNYLENLIGHANAPIIVWDPQFRITRFNQAFENLAGLKAEEVLGKEIDLLFPEGRREECLGHIRQTTGGGRWEVMEIPILRRDGSVRIVLWNSATIYSPDGKTAIATIAQGQDITERKRTEDALRKSEDLLRSYLENAPDGIYISDMEGNFLYGNRKCEEITGYRLEELIGKNFLELNLLSENSLNKAVRLLQANMEGRSTGPDEIELISKEGRLISVEINTDVVQRMGQSVVIASVRDITGRKMAAEKLRRSEIDVGILIEKNFDGIIIVDSEGILRFTNPAAEFIFGRKAEDLLGTAIGFPLVSSKIQEIEVLGKDGAQRMIEMRATSINWTEKDALLVSLHDITERKQAETNLRKSMLGAVQAVASIVELRDPYTAGHQRNVSTLAGAIAKEIKLAPHQIEGIRIAAMIHDIGKVNIPAEILSKPGKISAIEFSLLKEHAMSGYNILKELDFPWPLDQMILQHHERMDGSGYPKNLKGEEIIFEARIIAVADVVEAMASHRPYRPALGLTAALEEIEKNSGAIYDSTVVDVCLRLFREKGFQFEGTGF